MSDLRDLSTANTESRFGRCAEVRVGDHVTRYVRRGSGLPVVIVGANDEPRTLWASLVAALDGVRVIVPEATVPPAQFVTWLREFVEGIGVGSAVLIIGGDWCVAAVELQASGAGDFRALILVPPNAAHEAAVRAAMDARASTPVFPVLVVQPDWTADEAVRRVRELIGEVGT